MKRIGLLLVVLLLVPLLSCEEDVVLSDALADARSAAPTVCKDYCAWAQTCVWNSYSFQAAGAELPAAQKDWQQACLVTCANRADKGTFVYEADYSEPDDMWTYTFNERVGGKPWTAYFKCLWDNEFWICGEYGMPELQVADEAACTAYDTCVQILDVAIQYNWHPDSGENGTCHHEGFDNLWDGWSIIW
jgi:hypothetical protein